eukprot:366439-Chlamydomonas_euryale.AAC.4
MSFMPPRPPPTPRAGACAACHRLLAPRARALARQGRWEGRPAYEPLAHPRDGSLSGSDRHSRLTGHGVSRAKKPRGSFPEAPREPRGRPSAARRHTHATCSWRSWRGRGQRCGGDGPTRERAAFRSAWQPQLE